MLQISLGMLYSYIAFSLEHITWEVTTLSLKHLLTYPHTQDMGRSHLSMPGYGDPITTRGSHACILQEQKNKNSQKLLVLNTPN